MAHEPSLDPRIDWFSIGLAADFEVCEVGLHATGTQRPFPASKSSPIDGPGFASTEVGSDGISYLRGALKQVIGWGYRALSDIALMGEVPPSTLRHAIGALDSTDEDLNHFRWLCRFFLNVNSSLLEASRRIGGFDMIIAAELFALPAAVALAEEYDVPARL